MTSNRPARVAEAIKREMGELLIKEIKDSRVKSSISSVTDVEVTNDLRHAKIFVSIMGTDEQKQSVMEGLESAKGFIRSEIGKRINLRFAPEIHLKLDQSLEKGAKLIDLINQVTSKNNLEDAVETFPAP